MRILHVVDYFHPKLGYQEAFLAREHARLGHDVYVVTSDRYNPRLYSGNAVKGVMGERVVGSGFFEEEGIRVWRLKTLFEVPHAIWPLGLESKVRELAPDLVIAHGIVNFLTLRVARLKSRRGGFKLICDDHMQFQASRSILRILYPLFRLTFSHLVRQASDALVGIHDASRVFAHEKYGYPLDSMTIIPLGADDELFRFDPQAREDTRKRLSLDGDVTVFVYAGKVVPVKGPHLLVEAALKLMKSHANVKVVLIGDGPPSYVEEMKHSAEAEGLGDRFIWYGGVPNRDLPSLYSAADVAAWPRESSLSMLEAMACGLPVIISDSSEVSERVGYGNGLTYKGDDPSDLAKQMEKLLDPALRKDMGSKGRKLVADQFNWRVIAQQFLSLV